MVIIGNRLNVFSLATLFFICSCETVSDWTDSIGSDLSEVDPSLGEILADVESEDQIQNVEVINEEDLEILSPEENKEDDIIVDVEEKLPPAPQQEYDSALIEEESLPTKEVDVEITNNETKTADLEQLSNFNISTLSLEDKIQYKVGTINFVSGSSQVDSKGLKKIKKIAKLAKDRNAKIKIIGHASKRTKDMPIAEHKLVNFMISDKRAQSVAQIFIKKHNFPGEKLLTEAVSDSKPLFKEIMPAGTKANQRTEIFIIY
tara:strand:- start:1550 stop:2332 length:783 start_codon:yes stop_codon:yes gene_type:complete